MNTFPQHSTSSRPSVTVIGGGLAGLTASIHLARLNFEVTCIEPVKRFDRIVGESLDWSAPDLLANLGLPLNELIAEEVCTFKRHVILKSNDGSRAEYIPSEWLNRPPLNIELRTLHVDRLRLHERLMQIAAASNVTLLHDRVTAVNTHARRVISVQTAEGRTLESNWFVDASGYAASVFGRAFQLPAIEYGPKKIALWSHVRTSGWAEGTTLYADAPERGYMNWVWEIPINPNTVSVGYVSRAEDFKEGRTQAETAADVYRRRVAKVDCLDVPAQANDVHATSFRCRTYRYVSGPNWVIVGEAASVPDPITANGVTAALRQAAEASKLIAKSRSRGRISCWRQMLYSLRVRQTAKFFNSLIEKLIYNWPVRNRIGVLRAGHAYTIPAWSINHLYSRFGPTGVVSTMLFCSFLAILRGAAWCAYHACRLFPAPASGLRSVATCT